MLQILEDGRAEQSRRRHDANGHLALYRQRGNPVTVPEEPSAPVIYREEVRAIIGAIADLVVEVRRIRESIEEDDGEEETE